RIANGSAAAAFGAGTSSKPVTTRALATLATRELTARPTADRSRLPEVVVDPVRRVQTAERQLHAIADLHRLRVHVRHLALEAAGASGGCGSGRRGGSRRRKPRHVKNVAYDSAPALAICAATVTAGRRAAMASVVRHTVASAPSASDSTAMT